jgi:DNA-binding protein Fis
MPRLKCRFLANLKLYRHNYQQKTISQFYQLAKCEMDETILDEILNHLSLLIFELKERFSD